MKTVMVTVLFFLSYGISAQAQAAHTFGAWTTYPAITRHGDSLVLVQSTFLVRDGETQSGPRMLRLDAICKNGELYRVALETGRPIAKRGMNFSGAVPTTPISFGVGDSNPELENWAVLDGGRTLSPYQELRQQALNRIWVERLATAENLAFQFQGDDKDDVVRANFDTNGMTQALEAAGCSYE